MKRIFTHSGQFRQDEAMAVAIAKMVFPEADVVRVRELPDYFVSGRDIVVDIGGVHDPELLMFDGMAAAGKIWEHFGSDICGDVGAAEKVYDDLLDRADIGFPGWEPIDEAGGFEVAVAAATAALNGAIKQARLFCRAA